VSQADLNPQSFVSSEGVTITNATVTANDANMTISAKLKDSSVTNASSGSLTVADMTVTDASAKQSTLTGDMTVNKLTLASGLSETVAAVTTSGALTLGSITLDLTDYAVGNYTLVSATGDGSITWNANAENALSYTDTLGEGFEASVVLAADKKTLQLTISEMVVDTTPITTTVASYDVAYNEENKTSTLTLTVNADKKLGEGMVVNLELISEDMMQGILEQMGYPEGDPMVFLKLVGTNGGEILADTMNEVVFVKGTTGQNYWGEMVGGKLMYNVNRIPEPASATLSLAALMMLCARRRRQK
jgi:hypothetical protein